MVETAHEEDEEDKRWWHVFHGDLVRDIAHRVLCKHCGLWVDN